MAKMFNNRSQVDPTDFPINPASTSGVELADILNRLYNSIMSNQAGLDRPLNLDRGGIWSQIDPSGVISFWMFDGTNDIAMGTLVGGVYTPVGSDSLQSQITAIDSRVTSIESSIATAVGVPAGVITMWSGLVTNVPVSWALCNGENGTPDLRDRFIVGAGASHNTQTIGGSWTATIGINNMPNHNHGGVTTSATDVAQANIQDPSHAHSMTLPFGPVSNSYSGGGQGQFGGGNWGVATDASLTGIYDAGHQHTFTGGIPAEGGGDPISILPPFMALAYIMKL